MRRTLAALSLLVFAACAESGTTPVATEPGGPAVTPNRLLFTSY